MSDTEKRGGLRVLNHIRTERGDGNGTPPGIRISWVAIGVIMTVIGMVVVGGRTYVIAQDNLVRSEITTTNACLASEKEARLDDKREFLDRLSKIENLLLAIQQEQLVQHGKTSAVTGGKDLQADR